MLIMIFINVYIQLKFLIPEDLEKIQKLLLGRIYIFQQFSIDLVYIYTYIYLNIF